MLKKSLSKIILIILIGLIFYSCSITKKVPDNEKLLTKNVLIVNDTVAKNDQAESLLYQKPNSPIPLRLYNLAKDNPDLCITIGLTESPIVEKI